CRARPAPTRSDSSRSWRCATARRRSSATSSTSSASTTWCSPTAHCRCSCSRSASTTGSRRSRRPPAPRSRAESEDGAPMKLPMSWLRDWVSAPGDAPETVADALTRRGFYVEGIERHGHAYPGVVTARVLEVQKHPNADRLSLCRVDGGSGELRVVCGAPNVRAGMIVPLATVGATLPGGLVIKQSKIRGEESQGMLCSARELEISDEHAGILDLAAFLG